MPKYAIFFTFTGETLARFIEQPSDRAAAVQALVEPLGGKVEGYYFMFGQDDGMVLVDMPDSQSAAAASLAVGSTGAFARLHTHELIPADQINAVLAKAKAARQTYRPPGS
jgi:uncharacterized protein with GYD domain